MDKKLKIGFCGAWHGFRWRFADYFLTDGKPKVFSTRHWLPAQYNDCEIHSVWDTDPVRGKEFADYCGVPYIADPEEFMNDPELDAVIMVCETALHGKMTVLAAQAGKHVYTEKAPFATLEDAYLARDAVKKSGIHFMVSSPMDKPRNRYVENMIKEGKIGDLTSIRFHLYSAELDGVTEPVSIFNKEENGGGAMMDFGQHGCHMACWFLGKATGCQATLNYITDFAKKYQVEDSVLAIYEHENGTTSVVEAGWCAASHECIFDVCGTRGMIHVIGDAKAQKLAGNVETHDYISYRIDGGDWIDVPETDFPEKVEYPMRDWINHIISGEPDTRFTIDEAVEWTEMLCAAYRSAGKCEKI